MSVFAREDEMIATCACGCDECVHYRIDKDDDEYVAYQFVFSASGFRNLKFRDKLKCIWSILRGKDWCYSDILFKKEEWEEFKKWIASH